MEDKKESEINLQEYQVKTCKICNQTKKRYNTGKRPQSKETRFVSENGKEWNGNSCDECHLSKVKQTKKLNTELVRQAKKLNAR